MSANAPPFGAFERLLAFRYLRARKKEGFVSVIAGFSLIGIALGVATLIIVMAVMNGFRSELLGRILGLNGHLNIYGLEGPLENYDAVAERARTVPGVVAVRPSIETQALITRDGAAVGIVLRGLREQDFRTKPVLSDNIVAGDAALFGGDGVALGRRLADRLALDVGDPLTLISPQFRPGPFGSMPRLATYRVAALFEVGMFEYDSSFIFMGLETAQKFASMPDGVTTLEVMVENPDGEIDAIRDALIREVSFDGQVFDWRRTNSSFFAALQVERNVMFLILTLIILVAAFNIISSLIMLVKEKGRDIAILRTMGASSGAILRIFFLSGASIGVIGTLLGFLLGVLFCDNIESIRQFLESLSGTELWNAEIRFLSEIPAEMDWGEVIAVVAMALGLSFAATIYPALKAARTDPVEALRHE